MNYSLLKLGSVALFVAVAALIVSIACGSSEEEAAPTPDVAKIIQDAVSSVPQGASAAEIQKLVSDSVVAGLAGQPAGVTRAEVEAAVNSASAGQLSAADVQRIVDQSVRALPAPEPAQIDVGQLRSLVQDSVAASVPEGVSGAEISRLVQAAVSAMQAGAVTRGDLQDLVAKSIQDAAADQLTAAQVQAIVDASVEATQAAVDASLAATQSSLDASLMENQSALDASLMETQSALDASLAQTQRRVDSSLMETQSTVEEAAMAAKAAQDAAEKAASDAAMAMVEPVQPYGKPLGAGGYFDYRFTGPKPTTFQESPMSAELVKQGKLPPLMERLPVPEDVHVVPPPNEIGTYGGTWRATANSKRYLQKYANGHPLQLNADGASYVERVAKSMDISEDGRVYTFTLRNGGKWSSGDPLTSEDFRFTWEDINYYTNAVSKAEGRSGVGLGPDIPYSRALDPVTGEGARFTVIDDYNFSFTFDSPNYTFFAGTTSARGPVSCGWGWCWYTSDEYAKPFHEKYADPKALAAMMAEGGHESWHLLFRDKVSWTSGSYDTPDAAQPSAGAWEMSKWLADSSEMTRNHYYFGVDPDGNQLPYVDRIFNLQMESREVAILRSMGGETDMDANTLVISGIPLYLSNMERGDYSIYHWPDLSGGDHSLVFNQTYNDDTEIGRWVRTRDFRNALSLAINRDAINETVFSGVGQPQNYVVHSTSQHYPGKRWETIDAIPQDVARANQILDGLGLMDTDGDGIRNRLDGGGNLKLYTAVGELRVGVAELLEYDLARIGIQLNWEEDSGQMSLVRENKEYLVMTAVFGSSNPWARGNPFAPYRSGEPTGPLIGQYLTSKGEEGMAPTGPDPDWLPLAPADTWPADATGNLKVLLDNWTEGAQLPDHDPRKIELGKEMGRIVATEKYMLGTVAFTGYSRGLVLKRNNFRNVPERQIRYEHGLYNMVNYFEDGMDNVTNPGNRSRRYTSKGVFAGGTIRP